MALVLLTGSLSTHDASFGGVSVKCAMARLACQFTRGSTAATTFCSAGWVEETPGMKQMNGSLVGYASKGVAYSDPLVWFVAAPVAFVGTADTSCTASGNVNIFGDGFDLVAAANSSRAIDFRSTGAVTTAWVVA